MFSYFEGGIENCIPCKKISIERLVKEIRCSINPAIQKIRDLDAFAPGYEDKKKKLKQRLPYITPCCTVSRREDQSIIEFSGYMYFDIDRVENAEKYKKGLIEKYKDYISMICLSSSGRGLTIFTKVENEITKSNFNSLREYISSNVFSGLPLDPKTKSKSNPWFISYDPHVYYNPSVAIDIPDSLIHHKELPNTKSAIGKINNPHNDSLPTALFQFKLINISEVIAKLRFKTEVPIENKVFDLKPVGYCEVFLRNDYRIPQGKKMQVFAQLIHNLVYLNPEINADYIFSYINWLNYNKTVPGTEASSQDLIRHFNMVYQGIKKNGELHPDLRTKYFHCRPNTISPDQRKDLARRMTGMYKVYRTIERINEAKQILERRFKKSAIGKINNPHNDSLPTALFSKVTQKAVLELINDIAKKQGVKGMGERTLKTYWNVEPIDLEELVRVENEKIEITYIPKPPRQRID